MQTLRYADIRDKISSMDIVATSMYNLTARLIRAYTMSTFGHVGATFVIPRGHYVRGYRNNNAHRVLLFESTFARGVHFTALSELDSFYWLRTDCMINAEVEAFIWDNVCKGTPYDWPGIIRRAMGLSPKHDQRYYCSELLVDMFRIGGYEVDAGAERDPQALIDFFLNKYAFDLVRVSR